MGDKSERLETAADCHFCIINEALPAFGYAYTVAALGG
jgi:hypothetical protein